MKTLKEGKIKIDERFKKCKNCGCEFIYDKKKDIAMATIDGFDIYESVKCPTCGFLLPVSFFDKKVKGVNNANRRK